MAGSESSPGALGNSGKDMAESQGVGQSPIAFLSWNRSGNNYNNEWALDQIVVDQKRRAARFTAMLDKPHV
ncbi:hypothetical protein DTO280E4_6868 [Paecilomyces variotii]|nr:hypothetical protein DTO169C6_4450 [Paecilomyces variotii]KAJ9353545.1 hypothetical protein DTO027B9_5247 [Paecilomyces variotii]KAJ9354510.1 hypothetical protein DTO280E4_6868 [Paecilomyces variotii]